MNLQDFQHQANQYGSARQPFFFLIDFAQQKPLLCPLSQASAQGIYFDMQGFCNQDWTETLPAQLNFEVQAPSLSQYAQAFTLVQQELQKGNSYLLNLCQASPIQLNYSFRQLFQASQAPYKLLIENEFVCFSPECFIKTTNNQIATFPMKGTINAQLPDAEQQLLNDEKELREHYTIVDLMRNDLAMVATQIEVRRFRYLERIETARGAILQTSSEICGQLPEDWQQQVGSLLTKLLPAGSISGAPKEKTVQIIQQAERQQRGYYTGVFGIFDGENLQTAVAIRCIQRQDQQLYFHSGGGITIQSQLEQEYQELLEKIYLPISNTNNKKSH